MTLDPFSPAAASSPPADVSSDYRERGPVRHPTLGEPAPTFRLPGTGGRTYDLAEQRGESVVLVFYPADNSPVCTAQLRSYSEDLNTFEDLGAAVWCVSPQGVNTHEAFAREQDLHLPLLSDEDKSVGRSYDILGPLGFYRRSVFVVDPDGVIRLARRSMTSLTYIPAEELVSAVRDAAS